MKARAAKSESPQATETFGTPEERRRTRIRFLRTKPAKYAGVYRRAYETNSRAAAIRARCLDCCCDSAAEVSKCPCVDCPLWRFRMERNVFPAEGAVR